MKVYISGVGVGLGPIAFIARDLGYEVVCSDITDHYLVKYLRDNGFTVHIGQDGNSIAKEHSNKPIDWFIYSSAIKDTNPELVFARHAKIKATKRDGFINHLINNKNLKMIAIAGTHGKTNTTAMVAWCLKQANIPISYSIGAKLSYAPFGQYQDESQFFIYEADEFDRNFLHFEPAISIITNISYDHPDTYIDQVEYDQAFAQFIEQSHSVYMYKTDFSGNDPKIKTYEKHDEEHSTNLYGKYIRQNARLILEMLASEFDIDYDQASAYLDKFPGTSRRMEKLADNIYTDYAHHPDEIRATIEIGLEMSDHVVVVYQPHQNLRQTEILDSYTNCFEFADKVYWLPTYLSREPDGVEILSAEELIKNLDNKKVAVPAEMNKQLSKDISKHVADGALVIAMSAGNLDQWMRENFSR